MLIFTPLKDTGVLKIVFYEKDICCNYFNFSNWIFVSQSVGVLEGQSFSYICKFKNGRCQRWRYLEKSCMANCT